jgi:hypothetical protein
MPTICTTNTDQLLLFLDGCAHAIAKREWGEIGPQKVEERFRDGAPSSRRIDGKGFQQKE